MTPLGGDTGLIGSAPPPVKRDEAQQSIELRIEGMTCVGCAQTVTESLQHAPGVSGAGVNFATRRATVLYNPEKTRVSDLISAIEKAAITNRRRTSSNSRRSASAASRDWSTLYPASSIAEIRSETRVFAGLYRTVARRVAKLTPAPQTPGAC